jgi:hypothetical protein
VDYAYYPDAASMDSSYVLLPLDITAHQVRGNEGVLGCFSLTCNSKRNHKRRVKQQRDAKEFATASLPSLLVEDWKVAKLSPGDLYFPFCTGMGIFVSPMVWGGGLEQDDALLDGTV